MKRYSLSLCLLLMLLMGGCVPILPDDLATTPNGEGHTVRISPIDGMPLHWVPAGPFLMGSAPSDLLADSDEMPQHRVELDAFWIDRTEISNAHYLRCVEAGACPPIVTPRADMATNTAYPVQGATWPGAVAYCVWAGRRLPTEAEWEKAARGEAGLLYPWGDQITDDALVNIDFRVGDINAVGQNEADVSPYGVLDMAGNIREWVADRYSENYFSTSPEHNPTGPERSQVRVLKGGAWNTAPKTGRGANRFWAFPDRNDFDGFRCAKDG